MQKKEVITHFGSTTATAKALGISKSTVSLWKEIIPWKYALLIEKVTEHDLTYNSAWYRTLRNDSAPDETAKL
ncbi:Cro/CI family transcriptional regulator [Candidatus Regiella endosymbiont of Tuberolachnus salignus]|uniref:Cro/CI family transcriptional regulator n=1 Tax=Candidatus Regiella endosymbiont of Tuberolachnus salignus TaxID=3077956 RepID=UPI0030CFAABC